MSHSSNSSSSQQQHSTYKIKPHQFLHIHDNNTGVTRVEVGPRTFTRKDHEKVIAGPDDMVIVPPRHYCVISNPVERAADGTPKHDEHGNYKIKHGDEEIRFEQQPFPLHPGEKLFGKVTPLQVVAPDAALRLQALRDFEDGDVKRQAGDEWLFVGPGTYLPRVEVHVKEVLRATVIRPNQALKLRARYDCTDADGNNRRAGEEWLVRKSGSYLPGVEEQVVELVDAYTLTARKALHLCAIRTFTAFGVERKAGEEWLVTSDDAPTYIPDVYERLVGEVQITTLTSRQYCVVLDPIGKDGKPQLGKKELRNGPCVFFLRPGERLESGVQNVYVLTAQEALLLRAKEAYTEIVGKDETLHAPGDRWMIYGPISYVPPVEVEIVEKRRSIPLDDNEGIYVRDIKSGRVRAEVGTSYMLKPNEELWEKVLPATVEQLIQAADKQERDKTRVVSLRVPHNAAAQVYDYKDKRSRVVFGPDLVMLHPDEHFTVLSLSGGKPKQPHKIKALCLLLGPDFMTDIVTVETSDHARLQLKLSYNWAFDSTDADGNPLSEKERSKIFAVPDFVGDACKAIASRVRGAVAAVPFDDFHRNSARVIRRAVFGLTEEGKINDRFHFTSNLLSLTNIDIQSVEPVDSRTRDSLQKSVQLAIEITTKSQEAKARHEAERQEQEARGRLERQKIKDEAEAESVKKELLKLQGACAAIESTGQATADAQARAEAPFIRGQMDVELAQLQTQANSLLADADLDLTAQRQRAEIEHQRALDELEITRTQRLAEIEAKKFQDIVSAISSETIAAIARAGPEMQAQLLQGLGLQSVLISDGTSPINLFDTSLSLIGGGRANEQSKSKDLDDTLSV